MSSPPGTATPPAAGQESLTTVIVAFTANLLIAVAKTFASVLTGSASMLAEAAHSWADTGNEVFLLLGVRRSLRPADAAHTLGYGRKATSGRCSQHSGSSRWARWSPPGTGCSR